MRFAQVFKTSSPAACPIESLIALKPFMSKTNSAIGELFATTFSTRSASSSWNRWRLARPVSGSKLASWFSCSALMVKRSVAERSCVSSRSVPKMLGAVSFFSLCCNSPQQLTYLVVSPDPSVSSCVNPACVWLA